MVNLINSIIKFKNDVDKKVTYKTILILSFITFFIIRNASFYIQVTIGILVFLICLVSCIRHIINGKMLEGILMIIGCLSGIIIIFSKYIEFNRFTNDYLIITIPILILSYFSVIGAIIYKSGDLEKINRTKKKIAVGIVSSILILIYFIYLAFF